MKKALIPVVMIAAVVLAPLWAGPALDRQLSGGDIAIVISPNVVNLDSHSTWVTVHADIDFSDVDGASVALDGIAVAATFADDCGDLVAKFNVDDVKAILQPGVATLTLIGQTKDGVSFSGSDSIKVIKPRG